MAEATKIQLLLEAESRGILPPDKAELLAEARSRGLVREASTPAPEMTEQQFTQERQGSALQDAARGSRQLARGTVAGLGAAAGFIPGVGIPAQMAIGAGTETVSQLFGDEPMDPVQIGLAGSIPVGAKVLSAGLKATTRSLGKLVNPQKTKEAGIEAVAEMTRGLPTTTAQRATINPASKAAFALVDAKGPVPTAGLADTVFSTIDDLSGPSGPANKPKAAIEYLENLYNKFANNKALKYSDITDELSFLGTEAEAAMNSTAPGSRAAGLAMFKARDKLLSTMDNISDDITKANALYKKEKSTERLITAFRAGNAGTAVRKLIEKDKTALGNMTEKEIDDVIEIADEVSNVATNSIGITNRTFNTLISPIAWGMTTKLGRFMIRKNMKPTGHLTAAGLATVSQFMRAYMAQGGTD